MALFSGTLLLRVIEARNVSYKGKLLSSSSHIFVVLHCSDSIPEQKSSMAKGACAKWDHTFSIPFGDNFEQIVIQLWKRKTVTGKELIGIATLIVNEELLVSEGAKDLWLSLTSLTAGKRDSLCSGEIHVVCNFFLTHQAEANFQSSSSIETYQEEYEDDMEEPTIPQILINCVDWLNAKPALNLKELFVSPLAPSPISRQASMTEIGNKVFTPSTPTVIVASTLRKFFQDAPQPFIDENIIPTIEGMVISLPGLFKTLDEEKRLCVVHVMRFIKHAAIEFPENATSSPQIGAAVAHLFTLSFGPGTGQLADAITRFITNYSEQAQAESENPNNPEEIDAEYEENTGEEALPNDSEVEVVKALLQGSSSSSTVTKHMSLSPSPHRKECDQEVSDQDSKISALEEALTAKETEVATLQQKLSEIEANCKAKASEDAFTIEQLQKHVDKLLNAQMPTLASSASLMAKPEENKTAEACIQTKELERLIITLQQQIENETKAREAEKLEMQTRETKLLEKIDGLLSAHAAKALQTLSPSPSQPVSPPTFISPQALSSSSSSSSSSSLAEEQPVHQIQRHDTQEFEALRNQVRAKDEAITLLSSMVHEREQAVVEAVELVSEHKRLLQARHHGKNTEPAPAKTSPPHVNTVYVAKPNQQLDSSGSGNESSRGRRISDPISPKQLVNIRQLSIAKETVRPRSAPNADPRVPPIRSARPSSAPTDDSAGHARFLKRRRSTSPTSGHNI